ncbi:MAG: Crp/Fnr family transcriptional regulator, partial [Comamonadaceae bacterium]
YALVRGAIDISGAGGPSDRGRAALLTRLEPPSWFGEIAVFDRAPRTHDAHAAQACTLVHVPQEPLLAWLAAHPAQWHALALLLTDKLRVAFVAMEELALLPAPQRLARRLVLMAEGYGQIKGSAGTRRTIVLSQEELALMLAISRQTTNQILQDLQARGLLRVHRGTLEIVDLPGLKACG